LSNSAFISAQIAAGETDDPQFIVLLNSMVRGLIEENAPQELRIIKIDNWFDHKWLRFSGIGTVDFQFPAFMNQYDAALDEFYQDRVTFPPFTPNRVLGQCSFIRTDNHYAEAPLRILPHPSEKQPSEANLHRRVEDFSRSACFVWYGAETLSNGRASVMVYKAMANRVEAWFAAFNRRQGWKLHATKGTRRDDVEKMAHDSKSNTDERHCGCSEHAPTKQDLPDARFHRVEQHRLPLSYQRIRALSVGRFANRLRGLGSGASVILALFVEDFFCLTLELR